MIRRNKCPKCGEETLEKVWLGFYPQTCSRCGYQVKTIKIEF